MFHHEWLVDSFCLHKHGSSHTDCIVTDYGEVADLFLTQVDSILHSKFRTHSSKFAFLNPYKISGKACQETPIDVVSYLVAAMRLHHGTSFLVAPYLQSTHWILLVICPSNRVVYILDSLMKRVKNFVDNYYLLKHVELAFANYEKRASTPVIWIPVECNQQVDVSKSEFSGHYVMRWLYEFVSKRQFGFPSKPDTLWKDKTAYDEKILVSTFGCWAKEFLSSYMNNLTM